MEIGGDKDEERMRIESSQCNTIISIKIREMGGKEGE